MNCYMGREHSYEMASCIVYDVGRAVVPLDRHYINIMACTSSAVSHSLKLWFETQVFITHYVINACQTREDFAPVP